MWYKKCLRRAQTWQHVGQYFDQHVGPVSFGHKRDGEGKNEGKIFKILRNVLANKFVKTG